MSYFRKEIDAMKGYIPGEQPKNLNVIKLNTNENPYPPSPKIKNMLGNFDYSLLRRYPDPSCSELRRTAAELYRLRPENIIAGNGSDDILTMAFRAFTSEERQVAVFNPTYSLYKVLAQIQGASCLEINLDENFNILESIPPEAMKASMLIITRPNAPTGNIFEHGKTAEICSEFKGVVLIDEAYADFAQNDCMNFVKKFENVIVSRTLSKSYSLAGARVGIAAANEKLINGMIKVKDSYNVNMLSQKIAVEALKDNAYFIKTRDQIIRTRTFLAEELKKMRFKVLPSEANFVFAAPPGLNGEKYFEYLKNNNILVRFFPGKKTENFVRISVGTDAEISKLLAVSANYS